MVSRPTAATAAAGPVRRSGRAPPSSQRARSLRRRAPLRARPPPRGTSRLASDALLWPGGSAARSMAAASRRPIPASRISARARATSSRTCRSSPPARVSMAERRVRTSRVAREAALMRARPGRLGAADAALPPRGGSARRRWRSRPVTEQPLELTGLLGCSRRTRRTARPRAARLPVTSRGAVSATGCLCQGHASTTRAESNNRRRLPTAGC